MSKDALSQLSREELIALVEREREARVAHAKKLAAQAESQAETIRQLEQQQETLATELELHLQAIQELQRKREQLEHRLTLALQQLYGQRRERFVSPDQLMLFSVEDIEQLAAEAEAEVREQAQEKLLARRRGKQPPGHGRRALPEHLPREVIRHELSPEEKACPCCGVERAEIGCESSEQLEFIPASFKVLVHEPGTRRDRGSSQQADRKRIAGAGPLGANGIVEIWRPLAAVSAGRHCGAKRNYSTAEHALRLDCRGGRDFNAALSPDVRTGFSFARAAYR